MNRNVKKVLVIAVAALVVFAMVLPAFAVKGNAHGKKKGHLKFEAAGTVTAIDTTAGTVTVKVKSVNKHAKKLKGTEAVFTVTADTAIYRVEGETRTAITLADVKVGDKAKLKGKVDKTDPGNVKYVVARMLVRTPKPRK